MNATELFLKTGKPAGIFFCEKCRLVAATQERAGQCCQNYKCSKCGKDTGSRSWLICDACRDAESAAKERDRFEKAEKLTKWDGWVCNGDDFYESIEDMLDVLDEAPEYVWACKADHFVRAEVSDIIDRMDDDAYEDWYPETLNGLEELKAALNKFNEANKDVCSYTPDYTKAVLINAGVDNRTPEAANA